VHPNGPVELPLELLDEELVPVPVELDEVAPTDDVAPLDEVAPLDDVAPLEDDACVLLEPPPPCALPESQPEAAARRIAPPHHPPMRRRCMARGYMREREKRAGKGPCRTSTYVFPLTSYVRNLPCITDDRSCTPSIRP
jgi:hypothetical protein